jgi:hypothetical protein
LEEEVFMPDVVKTVPIPPPKEDEEIIPRVEDMRVALASDPAQHDLLNEKVKAILRFRNYRSYYKGLCDPD